VHLVVGLGNPGKTYQHTRHNVGFMVVDRLAAAHSIAVTKKRFNCLWGTGDIGRRRVLLAKPQTFMNLSGQAVEALMAYFKLAVPELLVIHDDLDLDFGRIKIVRGGGTGGHKGVRSIHETLEQDRYLRVKVGIGRPESNEPAEGYVLSPWYDGQRHMLAEVIDAAAAAVAAIFTDGLEKAMTAVNVRNSLLSAS
jgi:PTH1 family peptidyl-tRNA hydrolase